MKFALSVLLVVAVIASSKANLKDDWKEFAVEYPSEAIRKILTKHSTLDNEFMQFKKFLSTPEFGKAWNVLLTNEHSRNIIQYIQESGIDVNLGITKIAEKYHLAQYETAGNSRLIMPRTVISYLDEIIKALPKDSWTAIMKNKMQTSPEFKKMHDRLLSTEFLELLHEAKADASLAPTIRLLESKGLKLKKVFQAAEKVLRWAD